MPASRSGTLAVMQAATTLTGGCMCEAVRFELSEPLLGALYCHCKRCQRRTGTAFSVTALAAPGSFRIVRGEEQVRTYTPEDDGWLKSFCSVCGSALYTQHPDNPELLAVRMGTFDADPGVRPNVHQFVDYAPPWAPVPDDGFPRFAERISWE
jgi:hypothetical protein